MYKENTKKNNYSFPCLIHRKLLTGVLSPFNVIAIEFQGMF